MVRGQEGDDLHDEGSESTLYTIRGETPSTNTSNRCHVPHRPALHSRSFEERDVKVIFAVMEYDSANEGFHFELLEDVI